MHLDSFKSVMNAKDDDQIKAERKEKKRNYWSHKVFQQERDEKLHGVADDKSALRKRFMSEHVVQRKTEVNPLLEEARAMAEERNRKALAEAKRSRKLMVCGDARGGFDKLFSMVEAQDKKVGPFDAILCVGAFLPEVGSDSNRFLAYLQGQSEAPRDCYFIDVAGVLLQAAPSGTTLGANLHFLGAFGVREICGLRVAFLSGYYDPNTYETPDVDYVGGAFTVKAITSLQKLVAEDPAKRGIDIFLSAGWPAGIDQHIEDETQKPPEVVDNPSWRLACAEPLAELCRTMEPRYHIFGTANTFYQRPPFGTPSRGYACRCIGLGKVGSPLSKQQKWIHALALSPMAHMAAEDLNKLPPGSTACPFKKDAEEEKEKECVLAANVIDRRDLLELAVSSLRKGEIQPYWDASEKLKRSRFVCPRSSSSSDEDD